MEFFLNFIVELFDTDKTLFVFNAFRGKIFV